MPRSVADDPVGSSVRYNREIVRIFARKCVACHGPDDEIPLASYFDVRPWARAIREEILERRMPPWSAAHGIRPLANDASLTIREIAIVASWTDGGIPRGDPKDLPAAVSPDEWRDGPPDRELAVAVAGREGRRASIRLDPGGPAWIRGFDLRSSAPSAVRGADLFLCPADGAEEEWLGSWTPWYAMTGTAGGPAARLPAGATLRLELTLAYPDTDPGEVSLGLYLAQSPPDELARAIALRPTADGSDPRGRLRDAIELEEAADVLAFQVGPADAEGALELAAVHAGGRVEALLWVPALRPEWPSPFVLRERARLPAGTRLVVTAYAAGDGAPAPAVVSVRLAAPGASPES